MPTASFFFPSVQIQLVEAMQKRTLMLGTGVFLLTVALAAIWWNRHAEPSGRLETGGGPTSHDRLRSRTDGIPAKLKRENSPIPVEEEPAAQAKREDAKRATLDAIGEAATTYDAAQLPFLNQHLYDKDAEIRKAALDAMLVLGDAGAGKFLREASLTAATEEERLELVKAADYAELPPVDIKALMERGKSRSETGQESGNFRSERNRSVGKKPRKDAAAPPESSPEP